MNKRVRYVVLAAILLTLTAGVALLIPTDLLFAAKWHDAFAARGEPPTMSQFNVSEIEERDVVIGSRFPDFGIAAKIRKMYSPARRGCLVVGLGDCAACIQLSLLQWESDSHAIGVPIVAFTNSSVKDNKLFARQVGTKVTMVVDADNALHKALNCYWGGRVYYYDSNWHLKWQMNWQTGSKTLQQCHDLVSMIRSAR